MTLAEYLDWIRHVPRPTDEQCRRFSWHLCNVHSWYKGSLFHGSELVVYIDAAIGGGFTGGRRVVDGKWHAGPRNLQYRDHYGRLAYLWRRPQSARDHWSDYWLETVDETMSRAVSRWGYANPILPPEIIHQCTFVLYPYVDPRMFLRLAETRYLKGLQEVWAGRPHPGQRILRLLDHAELSVYGEFDYNTQVKPVWDALVACDWRPPSLPDDVPVHPMMRPLPRLIADLRWAMDLETLTTRQRACARHLWRHYRKKNCLGRTERNKIDRALHRLRVLCGH